MVSISSDEKISFERVLQEFSNLTNEQAYVHIFSHRIMQPIPNKIGEYFGCDQRIYMRPPLQKLVATVPENGQVFDVGAGAGDVVDFALKDVARGTIIHLEDPNPSFLKHYLRKLISNGIKSGLIYEGPLQDYYNGSNQKSFPQKPQNLILAIHMIYHLTDFTQQTVNPQKDLIDAISFLYGLLESGGSLFIVYADLLDSPQGEAICGIAEKFFRKYHPNLPFANNLIAIYQARNQLLGPRGSIAEILSQHYPRTQPVLQSIRQITHFFGRYIADIAVTALAAELCPSDKNPFDLRKLKFCMDYVIDHSDRIGLQIETKDVPQKGMWRANEPQVLATITKFQK